MKLKIDYTYIYHVNGQDFYTEEAFSEVYRKEVKPLARQLKCMITRTVIREYDQRITEEVYTKHNIYLPLNEENLKDAQTFKDEC